MDTTSPQSFGSLLRRYRLAADLTQEALAARAGLSARGLSDLERGTRRAPRRETVQLLCEALDLSLTERATLEAAARQPVAAPPPTTTAPPAPSATQAQRETAPLIGRAREVQLLQRQLVEGPPLLLVAGEPGIGKSRLLQAGMADARTRGWTVLAGGCHRRSSQESYAPFVGALERSLQGQSPSRLRQRVQGCTWLVHLLPELAEMSLLARPTWTLSPEQERRLLFAAVARYLANSAGQAGTLLVLDDLQWAGPDALDLLQALVRAPLLRPLRLLGAYRDTDVGVGSPLAVLVADLARERLISRIVLAPLPKEDATVLLETLLPETTGPTPFRQQILKRTGGVPFFLISCVQALQTEQKESADGDAVATVPWTVAESIRQRVAALPEVAQSLLGAVAVAGRDIDRSMLLRLAERLVTSQDQVLAALESAHRARLLLEQGPDSYLFAHDLIREVVGADLSAVRRASLHQQIAEILEQRPSKPAAALLAHHYLRANRAEKAVAYLECAGDQAFGLRAFAEAEGSYRQLIEQLQRLGQSADIPRATEKLGTVLVTLGQHEQAVSLLEEAIEGYRTLNDLERMGQVLGDLAVHNAYYYGVVSGMVGDLMERLWSAIHLLEDRGPSQALGKLYNGLAYLFHITGCYRETLAVQEPLRQIAQALGDPKLLVQAEVHRLYPLFCLGKMQEASRVAQAALPQATAARHLDHLCQVLPILGIVSWLEGDFATGSRYLLRALEAAQSAYEPDLTRLLESGYHQVLFARGSWEEARTLVKRWEMHPDDLVAKRATCYVLIEVGRLRLAEGAREDASRTLERSIALALRYHEPAPLGYALSLWAEGELVQGHAHEAQRRLAALIEEHGLETYGMQWAGVMLAWAELELGNSAVAQRLLEEEAGYLRARNERVTLVDVLWVSGLVLMRQERWQEAEEALQEALSLAQMLGYPYGEVKARAVAGQLSAQLGASERAREQFQAALAICARLGEGLYAPRIEHLLAGLAPPLADG